MLTNWQLQDYKKETRPSDKPPGFEVHYTHVKDMKGVRNMYAHNEKDVEENPRRLQPNHGYICTEEAVDNCITALENEGYGQQQTPAGIMLSKASALRFHTYACIVAIFHFHHIFVVSTLTSYWFMLVALAFHVCFTSRSKMSSYPHSRNRLQRSREQGKRPGKRDNSSRKQLRLQKARGCVRSQDSNRSLARRMKAQRALPKRDARQAIWKSLMIQAAILMVALLLLRSRKRKRLVPLNQNCFQTLIE